MNFTHWKTTANGFLAFFITGGLALLGTGSTAIPPKVTVWITIALAVARAWVGVLQQDAGTVPAIVSGAVQQVPSHEVPDDPTLKTKVVTPPTSTK